MKLLARLPHVLEAILSPLPRNGSRVFALLLLILLPAMATLSFDYGYSWDEKPRQKYGEMIWEYFAGARDRSAFEDGDVANQLYGGFFDVVCVGAQKAFPRADPYVVRHATGAVFGWIAVLSCGLLARSLFGPWCGVLAMLLLVLSPRFLAHSMNNPKDLPFAAFSTLAAYYLFKVGPAYPYVTLRHAVKLTLAVALALAIRAGGLLLLGYLAAVLVVRIIMARDIAIRHLAATLGRLAAISAGAILLASLAWPWALARPLYGPVLAFFRLSKFDWNAAVLYKGARVGATQLPWDYVPTWLLITMPFSVLIGAGFSLLWMRRRGEPARRGAIAGLWALFLFPVALIVIRGSTLYDGLRHLLFLVPLLAVLAAAGWTALLRHPRSAVRRFSAAALCIALLEPLAFEFRNHPNEVVYFNALAGGPAGAFGRYDLDYWGNCSFQSVRWAADLARLAGEPVVVTGGKSPHVEENARRFPSVVYRPANLGQHHLQMFLLRGSAKDVKAIAAREDAVFRVTMADGTPLCVVLPGPRYEELASRLAAIRAASTSAVRPPALP